MEKILTRDIIKKDNPHFGNNIRVVDTDVYDGKNFDFTTVITVGSDDSRVDGRIQDCWATYLWSPSQNEWCLGAN